MISVNNIIKVFEDGVSVLNGIDCQIKEGEVVAIIGPSGSGKSTFLRCMNLLCVPTYGEVWLDDKLLTPVDPYLHREVIEVSNTYKKLISGGMDKDEAVKKIKAEDLLNEKFSAAEGKEYRVKMKEILCSTGAIIGRSNDRNYRLLKPFSEKLHCDGFEFMTPNTF